MENLNLTSEIARKILAEAAARGVSVEELLESVIESDLDSTQNNQSENREEHFQRRATHEEWMTALREWSDSHSRHTPLLSDYAVSRESIYTREDEML